MTAEEFISANLRIIRKNTGLNQVEFAKTINVSDRVISHWECGVSLPSIHVLNIICKVHGYTVDEVISNHLTTKN